MWMEQIEERLKMPYWIVDILPKQVPENSPGQYFRIEEYFLKEQIGRIKQRHVDLILKLHCYMDISVDGQMNPPPEQLEVEIKKDHVCILLDEAMIVSEPDDTYLTVYHPDEACVPWNHDQTAWKIVYEGNRPVSLQLIDNNITE